jgi:hypothetical protein
MHKNLKIIIASVTILIVLSTGIYFLNKELPGCFSLKFFSKIKTDIGCFELKFFNDENSKVKKYEDYAKDYYSRISSVVKDSNLKVNFSLFEGGEGIALNYINFWIVNNDKQLFKSKYFWNIKNNKVEYNFYGFEYIENNNPTYIPLQDLILKPEYQNFKLNQ